MKYNCLIIDDEKVLADSTAEYFNLFGVSTVAVYGADGCRKFLGGNTAELILLDINLADGSGFDLCRERRRQDYSFEYRRRRLRSEALFAGRTFS